MFNPPPTPFLSLLPQKIFSYACYVYVVTVDWNLCCTFVDPLRLVVFDMNGMLLCLLCFQIDENFSVVHVSLATGCSNDIKKLTVSLHLGHYNGNGCLCMLPMLLIAAARIFMKHLHNYESESPFKLFAIPFQYIFLHPINTVSLHFTLYSRV